MIELELPVLARGPQTWGDLALMLAVLGGIVAFIAYVGVAAVLACVARAAEGLTILYLLMIAVRKKPTHWFWRPLVWWTAAEAVISCLILLVPAVFLAANAFAVVDCAGGRQAASPSAGSLPGCLLSRASLGRKAI